MCADRKSIVQLSLLTNTEIAMKITTIYTQWTEIPLSLGMRLYDPLNPLDSLFLATYHSLASIKSWIFPTETLNVSRDMLQHAPCWSAEAYGSGNSSRQLHINMLQHSVRDKYI